MALPVKEHDRPADDRQKSLFDLMHILGRGRKQSQGGADIDNEDPDSRRNSHCGTIDAVAETTYGNADIINPHGCSLHQRFWVIAHAKED